MSLALHCSSAGRQNTEVRKICKSGSLHVLHPVSALFSLSTSASFSPLLSFSLCFFFLTLKYQKYSPKKHIVGSNIFIFLLSQSLTKAPSHVIAFKLSAQIAWKKKNPPPFHSSNLCFKPDNHLMTVRQLKLSIIEAVIALGMLFFAVKHQHKSKWVKYACLLSHFHPTPLQYRQHVLLDASLWITCQVLMVCSDQINSLYQLPLMRMAGGIWVVCVFYCIWILNEGSYSSGSVKLSWRKAMKR